MAERHRMFLTGSERAEAEHIWGKFPTDDIDPRFVLVTDEEEQKIRELPAGVPVRPSQDFEQVAKIRKAELDAYADRNKDS